MITADRYIAALRFAATRHRDQRIPGTDLPYVVHVVSVAAEVIAAIAIDRVDDPDLAVACALLHDTIEDTATRHDELVAAFSPAVADGVLALTKDKARPDAMAESLRRIRLCTREIWIVKLSDRVTNMGPPPPHWSVDRRRAYRTEAFAIADALGAASPVLDARLRTRADAYAAFC